MGQLIKLDNLKFEKIMADYATIKETTIPHAVRSHARLLCVELARRTQPFGESGKKNGESAVMRDLLGGKRRAGIFAPISPAISAQLKEYSTGNIRLFAKKDGTVYGTDRAHFLPDASAATLRGIHKSKFVNGKMSAAGSATRDIGRWKFIDKYFVAQATLSAYVDSIKAKVGIAKSGWADCAKKLPKITGSATRGIPGWVTRHLGDYGLGSVQDNSSNANNPHVILTNSCKYADQVCPVTEQIEALANVGARIRKQMTMILKNRKTELQEAA